MKPYYHGNETAPPDRQVQVNHVSRDSDPGGYIADDGLATAVNVALILGKPLLLTGEPGTGKTELASHVAMALNYPKPEKFDTRSTSQASELFYRFDNLARFHSAHRNDQKQALDFITLGPLGRAILRTYPANDQRIAHLAGLLAREFAGNPHPERTVVLIDEIDKAPRDFPNDLLEAIDKLFFTIRELEPETVAALRANGYSEVITAQSDQTPVVIITSNSEKNLPDPFLRRCVYYHIPFPEDDKRLKLILSRRIKGYTLLNEPDSAVTTGAGASVTAKPLVNSAVSLFRKLRKHDLRKKPSTSELIEWVQYLLATEMDMEQSFSDTHPRVLESLGILVKTKEDLQSAQKILAT